MKPYPKRALLVEIISYDDDSWYKFMLGDKVYVATLKGPFDNTPANDETEWQVLGVNFNRKVKHFIKHKHIKFLDPLKDG